MSRFITAGDLVLNLGAILYAVVETDSEGLSLRVGLSPGGGPRATEIRVHGQEARTLLGWLRSRSCFLGEGPVAGHGARVTVTSPNALTSPDPLDDALVRGCPRGVEGTN